MENIVLTRITILTAIFVISVSIKSIDAVELLGITWDDSKLVSFDPYTGKITGTHVQLNPYEGFLGLTYDPYRNIIYALSQVENNVYAIDPSTLQITHLGNLHIDNSLSWGDAGALAYDPIRDSVYTAVMHSDYYATNLWSQLCAINLNTLELTSKGDIYGPLIASFAFNQSDGQLYGLAEYGSAGALAQVVTIDPQTGYMEEIFQTPYYTGGGFAKQGDKDIYYSWVNSNGHFYSEIDVDKQKITPLGSSDSVGVISAMVYKDFQIKTQPISTPKELPRYFSFTGHITEVYKPILSSAKEFAIGDTFTGSFAYDANGPYKYPDPNLSKPYGMNLTINGLELSSAGFYVGVENNFFDYMEPDKVVDSFFFKSDPENDRKSINFQLIDNSASVISNNNVLPDNFDLSQWDENLITFSWCDDFTNSRTCFFIRGVIDAISSDRDGDGIADTDDNCLEKYNPAQSDLDRDGIGNACDDDADGDGFTINDCNDLDASINPRACDIINDGIDQNCDGQDRTSGKSCSTNTCKKTRGKHRFHEIEHGRKQKTHAGNEWRNWSYEKKYSDYNS